jgi:hypothetical protein
MSRRLPRRDRPSGARVRPLGLLAVLALLGAGVVVGESVRPVAEPAAPASTQVGVVGATALCPDLRQQPDVVRTGVAVGTAVPQGAAGQDGAPAGQAGTDVTVRQLDGEPTPADPAERSRLPVPDEADAVADVGDAANEAALEVRATGGGAGGLAVQQTAVATAESVRGLATTRCGPARTDGWLLGGGTTVGESSVLVLANPGAEPAVVDVTVLTGEGPVDARPGRGISVPAEGRTVVPLDTLAPERSRLAVRVQAERGRVAAAVRHERSDGLVPQGVAYAAPADGPAEAVDVPALPSGPGGRSVWVTNPGDVDVVVRVEVTTVDGQYVPDGLDAVVVPAESTAPVDLSAELGPTPATVRVTSTGGPVLVVGVAEDAGEDDVRDLSYTGPAPALAAPGLLPDVTLDPVATTTVLLSALSGDAVVELAVVPVAGAERLAAAPRRVQVPGGRTVAVPVAELLPEGAVGRAAVHVRADPDGSPVHAGVVVTARPVEGPLLSGHALTAPAAQVTRPAVVRDPAVGAGSR